MEPIQVTVATAHEEGVFTLGFADDEGGCLLLSQSDQVDDQDSLLGMDSYAISTADAITFYGGLESASLNGLDLRLRLSHDASGVLGLPPELLLRLRDDAEAATTREGFRRVGVALAASY